MQYLKIHKILRDQIQNRVYQPGDLLPTEVELGQIHKVSRPTVAKALNLLSKEKLVRRKPGIGSVVLEVKTSGLKTGLLIPHLHETEVFEPICASIIESACAVGMQIVRPSELSLRQERRQLTESLTRQFIAARVNGVFFAPVEYTPDQQEFNQDILDRLSSENIRVVLLDRDVHPWPMQTPFDLVGIENIEAGFVMGSHLIDNGCRNLAFASAKDPAMTVHQRFIGTREALIQRGFRARDAVRIDYHRDEPEVAARQLMEMKPDGLVCANDVIAASLLRALLDLGADIPGRLKVCGFDDVKYASLLSVPLTTYHQPCEEIGKIAMETMINRIKNPDGPTHRITLKGRLVVRRSSEKKTPAQSRPPFSPPQSVEEIAY